MEGLRKRQWSRRMEPVPGNTHEGGGTPMTPRGSDGPIRLGVLTLPLAGLLALVSLYGSFQLGTGGILATGNNRAIVGGAYFVSEIVGNGLALTLLIFGVVALYAYLANSSLRGLALG